MENINLEYKEEFDNTKEENNEDVDDTQEDKLKIMFQRFKTIKENQKGETEKDNIFKLSVC